jgi:two-component system, OmpR family, response regulator
MVIDDDDDVREVLCDLMDDAGYEPVPHGDPSVALQAIVDGVVPAAIVLDYGLPGIGGVGFLSRLRASDRPWSKCPVLLLTGTNGVEQLGLTVEAMMTKPPDTTSLLRQIRELVATPRSEMNVP